MATYSWDDDTEFAFKTLDNGIRRQVREGLNKGMALRIEAARMKAASEDLIAKANDEIEAAMILGSIKSAKVEGVGALTLKENSPTSKLDKKKLMFYLVDQGVDAGVVDKCFKKATTETPPSKPYSVAFRAAEGEEK